MRPTQTGETHAESSTPLSHTFTRWMDPRMLRLWRKSFHGNEELMRWDEDNRMTPDVDSNTSVLALKHSALTDDSTHLFQVSSEEWLWELLPNAILKGTSQSLLPWGEAGSWNLTTAFSQQLEILLNCRVPNQDADFRGIIVIIFGDVVVRWRQKKSLLNIREAA